MIDQTERLRAERLAAAIDEVIADPEAQVERLSSEDEALVGTARRLARLPVLMGPPDSALEQQLMRRVRVRAAAQPRPVFRLRWAAVAVAAVLLVTLVLTPMGQTAVASFLAVFHLGRTQLQIAQTSTPTPGAQTAIRQQLTLAEAEERLSFSLPQPVYLPSGYKLLGVYTTTFPDLPEWVPQPIFVDLVYGNTAGRSCTLRVYPIMLGEDASIAGMNLQATSVEKVQDLEVNGQPAVLLRVGSAWQELVWEQGDLVLALWAPDLSEEEMLAIARSVR